VSTSTRLSPSTTPSPADLARSGTLEELYGKLDVVGMGPGWNKPTPSLWPAPRKTYLPAHWRYELARSALDAAGRLINTSLAERRNLILFNPVEGNTYGTVRTLVAAYQMIMPGERARVHRHTPNALRLILDAEPGTYTEVAGTNIAMAPGDVLLTPNWSTHGHGNDGKACAYWLDFLDAPLVQMLEPMFFETAADEIPQAAEKSDAAQGAPAAKTATASATATRDSPLVFTREETLCRLDEATPDPSGAFATQIELGSPALATTALFMMKLRPQERTKPYRTTANNIYAVVGGEGITEVDGVCFSWSRGDVVAAPAWRPHWHEASADAILLRVTDAPVMQRFGWWREDVLTV
jgi:gentisate 1,2-dioxygenase